MCLRTGDCCMLSICARRRRNIEREWGVLPASAKRLEKGNLQISDMRVRLRQRSACSRPVLFGDEKVEEIVATGIEALLRSIRRAFRRLRGSGKRGILVECGGVPRQ